MSRKSNVKSKVPESGRKAGSGGDFAESIQSAVSGLISSALALVLQSLQAQSTSQQNSSRVSSISLDPNIDNSSDDDDFQAGPVAKKM